MRPGTVTELAKERGVSRARVYQWLEAHRFSRLEDGSIDLDDANAKLDANLDQAKGIRRGGNVTSVGPAAQLPSGQRAPGAAMSAAPCAGDDLLGTHTRDDDGVRAEGAAAAKSRVPGQDAARDESGYWSHKTREAAAQAQLKEMQALREAGALVPAAIVEKTAYAVAKQVLTSMLAIADRVAPVLDPANPGRAHKLLTDEIQKATRGLSVGLEQRAAAAGGAGERGGALL